MSRKGRGGHLKRLKGSMSRYVSRHRGCFSLTLSLFSMGAAPNPPRGMRDALLLLWPVQRPIEIPISYPRFSNDAHASRGVILGATRKDTYALLLWRQPLAKHPCPLFFPRDHHLYT